MSDDIAIKVEGLSKCYQIYDQPRDRLKQFVMPRLQRLAGQTPKQYFREFWALKDVSFEVKKGETVGIIGRNGSGKSTLLQMICGTLNPTSGSIQTNGRIAALLELGSGFNPEFTGRENVYMNAAILGLQNDEINARFDDIAAFADIGDFIEQPVKTYSSGMMVRLAFAVQAMVDPDVLIVDEALAVGDEKFQRKCFARLEELKSYGTSIIFVSHTTQQIVELCEKALLLERGVRLMHSSPLNVTRSYQKLIYAPFEKQAELINEYRNADTSGIENFEYKNTNLGEKVEADTYDRKLVPDTRINYPVQGAEISSIKIMDSDGRSVNVLSMGREYRFVMSGHMLTDSRQVHFGLHIRAVSGLEITGQRFPEEGCYIETVKKNEKFKIEFHFKMSLLPGTYFSGGGIWSTQEPSCLHRIMDAMMFRVIPDIESYSFGYVDLASHEPIIKLF
jgi:lipopolysaccharide transport system ATP-binding protein